MGIDKTQVFNCDCMQGMSAFEDGYFDLAIVDPPYGIGAENHAGNVKNGWTQWPVKSWDSIKPNSEYFKELNRVSKNQIIWGGNYFTKQLSESSCWIVWDKGQRDFSLADGELAWTSFEKSVRIHTIHRGTANQEEKLHPTQKPVSLYKWLLKNYAKEGDKILDTHLGSGSIAIACHDYGFDLTACELDKDYYDASIKRLKNHISQIKLEL